MSTFTEQSRLAAESDVFETKPGRLNIADRAKHIDVDDLNRLIDRIDALKHIYANILEPRGQHEAAIRQDARKLTLRKARNSFRPSSPPEEVPSASASSGRNARIAKPWRSLSVGAAAIVAAGVSAGLLAKRDSWGELFSSCRAVALGNAIGSFGRPPRRTPKAEQNGPVLGLSPSEIFDKLEHRRAASQEPRFARPTGLRRDNHGAASESAGGPATPAPGQDAQLSKATAMAPLAFAPAEAPAPIGEATGGTRTMGETMTPESRLGYPASALAEAARGSTSLTDAAPMLERSLPFLNSITEAAVKGPDASSEKNSGACFIKIGGRVYVNGSCHVSRTNGPSVTFDLPKRPVTITFDHGRTWTATVGTRQLGKVVKRDACWGSKKVYVCEHAL
jgi:hypothetical protein